MRKILYLFLLISLYLSGTAYAEISKNQWDNLADSDKVMIVREELQSVIDIEEQIDQLKTVALRKKQVKKLSKRGLDDQIAQLFLEDEEKLKGFLVEKELSYTILYLEDLKLIYSKTKVVDDQLMFYDALIEFQQKQYNRTQIILEELIKRYPSSNKYKSSLYTLQNIYMKNGEDEKFIDVYVKYRWDKSLTQSFWYGHALYNLSNYYDASLIFETLTSDSTFGFRAQVMVALITTFTTTPENGLDSFLLLMENMSPETPYYEILPLNIARLFAQVGDQENATKFYSIYNKLVTENGRMTNDVKFEIAVMSMNSNDKEMSKALLDDLLIDPYASEYYTACVYLLSTMSMEDNQKADADVILNEATDIANSYLDILIAKHRKVNELKDLKMSLFDAKTKKEKLDIISKIQSAENKISMASEMLLTTASGVKESELKKLWGLENDYIDTVNITVDEILKIYLIGQQPNDSRVLIVDEYLILTDKLYILSLAKRFLLDMTEITTSDVNTAISVATEIYESKKMVQMWDNVKDVIRSTSNESKVSRMNEFVRQLEKSVANLENEMELKFGDYWESPEVAEAIEVDLNGLLKDRENLLDFRKFVAESFNERLAAVLMKRAKRDAVADDSAIDKHSSTVTVLQKDIRRIKTEFDYTMIDLLYIDSVNKDEDFKRSRDRESNSTVGGEVTNE